MVRFSLKSFIAGITVVGLGVAALLNASYPWAVGSWSIVLAVLLTTVLSAVFSRGGSRAFFIGASIFGWSWILLSYSPPSARLVNPLTAVDELLDIAGQALERRVPTEPKAAIPRGATYVESNAGGGVTYGLPILQYFRAVGHAMLALMFGVCGGLFGRLLFHLCSEPGDA